MSRDHMDALIEAVEGTPDDGPAVRTLVGARLDELGHSAATDIDGDAAALAALGLGEMPSSVDAADAAFLADLVATPAGSLPPGPTSTVADMPSGWVPPPDGARLLDRPSALSRPMAMIPPEEMLAVEEMTPNPAVLDGAPAEILRPAFGRPAGARRRWGAWIAGLGTAAAALLVWLYLPQFASDPSNDALDGPVAEKTAPAAAPATAPIENVPPPAPDPLGAGAPAADDEKAAAEEPASDDVVPAGADEKAAIQPDPRRPPAGDEPAKGVEPAAKPVAATPKPAAAEAPTRRTSRRPARTRRPAAAAKPAKAESTSEVDDLLGALDGSGGGSKSRAPAAAPAASPEGAPVLPEKLTRRQLLGVVKKHASAVQGCKGEDGTSGTFTVRMVIAPSGQVSRARVTNRKYTGTPQAACVERTVKAMRFPAFSGDPMNINMPFSL